MVDILNVCFFFPHGNNLKISQVQQSKNAAQNEVVLWGDLFGGGGLGEAFLVQWSSPSSLSLASSIKFQLHLLI